MEVRPKLISVLCVFLFIEGGMRLLGAIIALTVFSSGIAFLGIVINSLTLLSYIGLWKMRKWSVWLFISVWGLNYLFFSALAKEFTVPIHSIHDWVVLLLPLLYFPIVLRYWNRLLPQKGTQKFGVKP
jgi:hypothetical protein